MESSSTLFALVFASIIFHDFCVLEKKIAQKIVARKNLYIHEIKK